MSDTKRSLQRQLAAFTDSGIAAGRNCADKIAAGGAR